MISFVKKVLRYIKHHLQEKNTKELLVLSTQLSKKVDSLTREVREIKKLQSMSKKVDLLTKEVRELKKLQSKNPPPLPHTRVVYEQDPEESSMELDSKHVLKVAWEYLLERCAGRKLLVYGIGHESKKICKYLASKNVPDLQIDYVLAEESKDEEFEGKQVISYLDIIFEAPDSVFVIIAQENECYGVLREKFINLGFSENVDFTYYKEVPYYNENYHYDVTLSYNRIRDSILGFELFGDLGNPNALKIVVLGGSTTESVHSFVKGWAPFLSDLFTEDDIHAIIYCGGIAAYTSSQELLKLIRDVIPLKPDIVLSYSGVNDLYRYPRKPCNQPEREERPFITTYQVDFMQKVNNGNAVYYGLSNNKSVSEHWLDNIRMMRAISEQFNILFLSFLQPFYHVGEYKLTDSQKAIFNRKGWYSGNPSTNLSPERTDFVVKGHQDIREATKDIDYITDLTNIFDEYTNIYRDACHVTEIGNKIIASNIFEELKDYLRNV